MFLMFVPDSPLFFRPFVELLNEGKIAKVPLLTGHVNEEARMFVYEVGWPCMGQWVPPSEKRVRERQRDREREREREGGVQRSVKRIYTPDKATLVQESALSRTHIATRRVATALVTMLYESVP